MLPSKPLQTDDQLLSIHLILIIIYFLLHPYHTPNSVTINNEWFWAWYWVNFSKNQKIWNCVHTDVITVQLHLKETFLIVMMPNSSICKLFAITTDKFFLLHHCSHLYRASLIYLKVITFVHSHIITLIDIKFDSDLW